LDEQRSDRRRVAYKKIFPACKKKKNGIIYGGKAKGRSEWRDYRGTKGKKNRRLMVVVVRKKRGKSGPVKNRIGVAKTKTLRKSKRERGGQEGGAERKRNRPASKDPNQQSKECAEKLVGDETV